MNAVAEAADELVAARFVGWRPCPARPDFVELVVAAGTERLTWCLPVAEDGLPDGVQPDRVELRVRYRRVQVLGRFTDEADEVVLSATEAVRLLGERGVEIRIDRRLLPLH